MADSSSAYPVLSAVQVPAGCIDASIAQRHDSELKDYFDKKRGEGKRYKEATVAVARKVLCRVYAIWKRQTPYVKRASIRSLDEISQIPTSKKVLT